jgi:predicted DNA-binding transcriptional regulator AlpA
MENKPTQTQVSGLFTEHQVAALLQVSVATIRRRRLHRQSPAWVKIGSSVRYKSETIQDFINNCPTGGTEAK